MGCAIRRADPADHAAIGSLTSAAYLSGGFIAPEAPYAAQLADAASRAAKAELYVAVDDQDGELLGTVTFAAYGSAYAEVSGPGEGEFRMLAVAPAARGRGVGEALVRHCLARGRALGLTALVISTQPQMRSAHRVYERVGFTRAPELDWSPVPGVELLGYRVIL